MIFIRVDETNKVNFTHFMPFDAKHGLGKTEDELLKEGYLVESLPTPDTSDDNKIPVLKFDGANFYYDYEDIPPTEMDLLKSQNTELMLAVAELGATSAQNTTETQLAIAELASLLTGGDE